MMKLLNLQASPILRLLSRKRQPDEPGLSNGQMEALRALTQHPKWHIYKEVLDILITNNVQGMLAANEDSQVHYYRGYIQGLLHAAQVPEQLIAQEDNVNRKQSVRDAAVGRQRAAVKPALYSTGY